MTELIECNTAIPTKDTVYADTQPGVLTQGCECERAMSKEFPVGLETAAGWGRS